MPYDTTQWIWAGGALIAMVALLLLLGRAARLAGLAQRGGNRLRIEESVALDARRRITLVRVDGRAVVLLTGGSADCCLGWLPEAGP